jgi:hypothetical protein
MATSLRLFWCGLGQACKSLGAFQRGFPGQWPRLRQILNDHHQIAGATARFYFARVRFLPGR